MFLEFDDLVGKPCDHGLVRIKAGVYDPVDLAWVILYWKNPKTISPELLIELLDDDNYSVRRACASALGEIGNSLAIPALVQALDNDNDYDLRRVCIWALGKIGDPSAIPALVRALKGDEDYRVRRECELALGKIEDKLAKEG
jgi:HEAT repeat protein